MKKVILIGDSIRMGYEQTVRVELAETVQVSWAEMNGFDSRNVLAKLDEWAIAPQPDLVHLNCGLHDLKRDRSAGGFQVPPADYAANVEKILQQLLAHTSAKILWATTTPVNEHWHRIHKPFDRFEADVQAYNDLAREICGRLGVAVDDLYTFVMQAGRDRYMSPDGVHFTADGYELLGVQVAKSIRENL